MASTSKKSTYARLAGKDKQSLHRSKNNLGQTTSDRPLPRDTKFLESTGDVARQTTSDKPVFGDTTSFYSIEDETRQKISLTIQAKFTKDFYQNGGEMVVLSTKLFWD